LYRRRPSVAHYLIGSWNSSVARKTVDTHRCVTMAAITELPRGGYRNPVGVLVASSMATDTIGQTMATYPDATFHCLLTLVVKKFKVRPTHHANWLHTTLTPRTREKRLIRNDRQWQNTSQHDQGKQLPNGSHRLFATALLA
jgi:hypothetical protein